MAETSVQVLIKRELKKQETKLIKKHSVIMTVLRNTMLEWVKEKLKPVADMLIRDHWKVKERYEGFRASSEKMKATMDTLKQRLEAAERALTPVHPENETEYSPHVNTAERNKENELDRLRADNNTLANQLIE